MSRHSKWSKVKQFKGAIDAKRSASFTKLGREITVAAREKGGDPNFNPRLRAAIDRAKEGSMPKENIERAIVKGVGGGAEGQIESLTYEAYAPGGTALIIESLTDNRNRAANQIKHLLTQHDASLATSGSVTYLFDHCGVVRVSPFGSPPYEGGVQTSVRSLNGGYSRDELELTLIDAGAIDIMNDESDVEIRCAPNDLAKVADAVMRFGLKADTVEFQWIPKTLVETNEEIGTSVAELIEALEADDDVRRVFSNLA